jgi:hypothetical protein
MDDLKKIAWNKLYKYYEKYEKFVPNWEGTVYSLLIVIASFFTVGLLYYKATIQNSNSWDNITIYYIPIYLGIAICLLTIHMIFYAKYNKEKIEKENSKKKYPSLSGIASVFLSEIKKGHSDLIYWYINFWRLWEELPSINNPYIDGFAKWELEGQNLITIADINNPLYCDGSMNINGMKHEWKLYNYPHNAANLFQCFFKTFPKIADVDTEKMGELAFKNPFKYLHESTQNSEYNIGKINKEVFKLQAKECNDSKEFHLKWEELKKTMPPSEIQFF